MYWNPKINIADGGQELSFFSCDNVARYKIIVEGITESGKICLGTGEFEVDRFREIVNDSSKDFTSIEALNKTASSETLNKNQSAGEVPPVSESFVEATAKIKDKINPEYFITGILKDKNKLPVEFATLYNLTQKTSSITNAFGEFKLEAQIGDSVKIQHLNYKSNYYKIQKKEEEFILVEKDFLIEEVMVSPQFAFDLFNKSCENTWKSFKEENTTKAYAKCTRKLYGKVVAQEAFLDLDIVQKKLQSYKKGEKTSIYRVQEKTERLGKFPENDFLLDLNMFYPSIQQIYWVDLPKSFNYLKREESNFIKLVLSSKSTYDHKCNIEVSINKKDTTLHSFAMVKKDIRLPYLHSKMVRNKVQEVWDTILVQKTYHYIEYDYSEGFGYLSEYVQGAVVKPDREIEILEHLKTYENGAETFPGRKSNNRIFSNRLVLRAVKNHYETQFWKDNFFPYKFPFDFERLENLKIGE